MVVQQEKPDIENPVWEITPTLLNCVNITEERLQNTQNVQVALRGAGREVLLICRYNHH